MLFFLIDFLKQFSVQSPAKVAIKEEVKIYSSSLKILESIGQGTCMYMYVYINDGTIPSIVYT